MPAPLTMTARRAMVAELRRQEPGISARKIADRLGAGKDTILRDIAEIETEQRQRAAEAAASAASAEPPAPPDAPEGDTLVIRLDEPMRQALATLRAAVGSPDTPTANRRAARAAIRAMADHFAEQGQQVTTPEGSRP